MARTKSKAIKKKNRPVLSLMKGVKKKRPISLITKRFKPTKLIYEKTKRKKRILSLPKKSIKDAPDSES